MGALPLCWAASAEIPEVPFGEKLWFEPQKAFRSLTPGWVHTGPLSVNGILSFYVFGTKYFLDLAIWS